MKKRARRNHSPVFKAKVAIAAIKGDRTLAQLSEQFDVHANQITGWRDQHKVLTSELHGITREFLTLALREGLLSPPIPKRYIRTTP